MKQAKAGGLLGQEWIEAVGNGPNARHDVPSLVMHRLLGMTNRMNASFTAYLERQHDISFGEFRVLISLARMVEAASHEIAEVTGLSTMNVSRAVAALIKEDRVVARVDPKNRRRKILSLTKAGQELFTQMVPTSEKVADYMIEDISKDDLVVFSKLVSEIITKLDETDEMGRSVFLERTCS